MLAGGVLVTDAGVSHRPHPPRHQVFVPRPRSLWLGRPGGTGIPEPVPLHVLRSVHHAADRCGGAGHQFPDQGTGPQVCEFIFSGAGA